MTIADQFENHRAYLVRLAYRMLGCVADAEDAAQETYVRWRSAGEPELKEPRAWFTTTCTRLCLDQLKSARRQRSRYVGQWLPEPLVETVGVDDQSEIDESVSMALLVAVEKLKPAERAAFLLHDVLDCTFNEVADALELEPANCRQLAARARQHLKGDRLRGSRDRRVVETLSDAFFKAARAGDYEALKSVLADEVVLRSDGGDKAAAAPQPIEGAEGVARFLVKVLSGGRAFSLRSVWFNGAPGVVVCEEGRPVSAFYFQADDDRLVSICVQRNPDKLASIEDAL